MEAPESPGLGHGNVVIRVEAPLSTRIQRMGHTRPYWTRLCSQVMPSSPIQPRSIIWSRGLPAPGLTPQVLRLLRHQSPPRFPLLPLHYE